MAMLKGFTMIRPRKINPLDWAWSSQEQAHEVRIYPSKEALRQAVTPYFSKEELKEWRIVWVSLATGKKEWKV